MAKKKSSSLLVHDPERGLKLYLLHRGRFLFIAAMLVGAVLSASRAQAIFDPTRFQESLIGYAFGDDADWVYGPSIHVPYSIEFDYEDNPPGDDFLAIHSKAQTNGGIAPAVDIALDFSAWSSGGSSLEGIAEATILYQFRVDYTGGETPPTTVVPLVMTYHLETRMRASGFGVADSYVELSLAGPVGSEQLDSVSAYYSWDTGLTSGGQTSGGVMRLLDAGPEYIMRLNARAQVFFSPRVPLGMNAAIVAAGDPHIEFAPDFEYADDYEIVVEPGSLQDNPDFQWTPMPAIPFKGDYEPDGDVDGLDLNIFITAYAIGDLTADLDNSGIVDTNDLDIFAAKFGQDGLPVK